MNTHPVSLPLSLSLVFSYLCFCFCPITTLPAYVIYYPIDLEQVTFIGTGKPHVYPVFGQPVCDYPTQQAYGPEGLTTLSPAVVFYVLLFSLFC